MLFFMVQVQKGQPALVLAPMDGVTDAPMRATLGEIGSFSYSVTEFIRVSGEPLPPKVFAREVVELSHQCRTSSGLPVQLQILGGDPDRMATSAQNAVKAGACSIDINFGCPAPTVNRNDGGATLLKYPERIFQIVHAVRSAVPQEVPVSAKLRLGWENIDDVFVNAEKAVQGGANWITLHARTRAQVYRPPVFWSHVGMVRSRVDIPVIANGDIWNMEDFLRCQEMTGCEHYMLGRAALANPALSAQIARYLGLVTRPFPAEWNQIFSRYVHYSEKHYDGVTRRTLFRLKQWAKMAWMYGDFQMFDELKGLQTTEEFLQRLTEVETSRLERV
jgi:tRNA-dihydrouridine synthase C